MSIPCPKCGAVLNPKGLKPGQFKPKCPKCAVVFLIIVPEEPGGTIAAKLIPEPRKVETRPDVTGDFTDFDSNATGALSPTRPDVTGNFTEPAASNPNATGAFTEHDADPNATAASEAPRHSPDETSVAVEEKPKTSKKKGDDDIPDRLGGYEVLKVLGKGGMGAVLLGRQVSLDRNVALKIMHQRLSRDPGFVARFVREAYAAAQLTHHNVIQIYDIGEDRGTHFFSMEFVNGKSLMDVVKKEGKLAPEVAVGYILQAARGLKYGHAQGMVHRDIKPDNLMVNTEGVVKVADLGLVKVPTKPGAKPDADPELPPDEDADYSDTQRLTRAGSVMGTPAYMAPEQARDSASVDARADIYSLGCSLYVMVTGKPPFEGKTAFEVMSKHQTEPLVPPEAIVKRVPKALSGILIKMLAKKPEDRYQTMDDVILALQAFLGEDRSGPFSPKEEHADALEKAVEGFHKARGGPVKKFAALGFVAACVLGIVVCGALGKFAVAGGLLGLLILTPLLYFVIQGVNTNGYLFGKARELVLGSKITDWLTWFAGFALLLGTLYVFGWLLYWLGFLVLAGLLAYGLYAVADKPAAAKTDEPVNEMKSLFKAMRLQGLDEDSLRQFVCKYSGERWEGVYEHLFGYEAKLSARAWRKGAITEPSKPHGAWREPILAWLDARLAARKEAKEQKYLQKIQAKALEAKGVSAKEANEQAGELAAVLVGQAAEVRASVKQGKPADVKAILKVSKLSKRPPAGYNLAGIKLKERGGLGALLESFFGRRFRVLVGGAVFALGILWLHQSGQLKDVSKVASNVADAAANLDTKAATDAAKQVNVPKPTAKGLDFLPDELAAPFRQYGAPICGFLAMLTGVFYFGWRPTLAVVPGLLIALLGPSVLGPDLGVPSWIAGTAVGAVLIVGGGRVLRG